MIEKIVRILPAALLVSLGMLFGPDADARPDRLRVAITALPAQVGNPYRYTGLPAVYVTNAIFDSLTNIGPDGEAQPWLALGWERTEPSKWIFHLRPGVRFSNGEEFDAQAVKHALDYARSPASAVDNIHNEFADIESATALGPLAVEITTAEPDVLLPRRMSMLPIVAPGAWKELGREGFARTPVGTGPYEVSHWAATKIRLAAFTGSWRAPKVDELEIIGVTDPSSRVQALMAGRIDIAMMLGPEDTPAVEAWGDRMLVYPVGGVMGLAFVTTRPDTPVRDVRVRRALNLAVNKQAIIDGLLGGAGEPAGQPATRSSFGYNPDVHPYPYDPAAARELLAEAGYPDGLDLLMEAVPGTIAGDALVFQQVAADLAKVGVRLAIRVVTFPTYSRHYVQGEWEGDAFGIYYVTEPYMDALRPMRRHSCLWRSPWYCDEDAMPLIHEAMTAPDLERRRVLTRELMRRYHDEAAGLYLHEVSGYIGLDARVRNMKIVNGFVHYHEIELAD